MHTRALLAIGAAFALAGATQLGAQEKTVTATGCLQRADTARRRNSTAATAATSGIADEFVLMDAHIGRRTTEGSSGANGHAAAAPRPWFAVAGNTDDLRARLDHRVEITGTLDTNGSVVGTSASVTDGPSGTIRAKSIKVVNASCSQ